MADAEISTTPARIAKLPLAASFVALLGMADSIYLTIHHYTAEPVPCGAAFDCEMVLTSPYAEIGGLLFTVFGEKVLTSPYPEIGALPLAAFGAGAYFVAFSLAILTAFGYRGSWTLFGIQAIVMAVFSGWLIYVQAAMIGAFCQFCLISAATSITLFILYFASLLFKARAT